jgi:hypothetical protein
MFARLKRTTSGRIYLQIVHSFRTKDGPRQRVVATLGRVDHVDASRHAALLANVGRAVRVVKPTRPKAKTKEDLVAQGYGLDVG